MRHVTAGWWCVGIAVLTTCLEILWATPQKPAASDLHGTSPSLLPIYVILAVFLSGIARIATSRLLDWPGPRAIVFAASLVAVWVMANAMEYADRVGAWSTFSPDELLSESLRAGSQPIAICGAAATVAAYLVLRWESAARRAAAPAGRTG